MPVRRPDRSGAGGAGARYRHRRAGRDPSHGADRDGRKLDRPKVLGPKKGGAIKLSPISSIGSELAIGEGIETTLSARPLGIDIPAWSLCDAGGLSQFPVLPSLATVERLTILADNDASKAGQNAAAKTKARWEAARRCVRVLTPRDEGSDFNDLLMARDRR